MATATEIVTGALRRLRVISPNINATPVQLASGTSALNAMIQSWTAKGLSNDVLPLPSKHEQGITALLAVRLAGDFGKVADPSIVTDAREGWAGLCGDYFAVPGSDTGDLVQEAGLTVTPGRYSYFGI